MEFSAELLGLLGVAAFFAGMVDAIAGGSGLIIVPLLFLIGLDPVAAIATNKLQSSFGSLSSTLTFMRAGHIELRRFLPLALISALAALIGAWAVTQVSSAWLAGLMPVLLIFIAVYFAFSASIRDLGVEARWPVSRFALTVVPVVGFYDGFFGPGAGSFFMLGLVALLGLAAVPATGLTKYLNLASNLGGLVFFIAAGKVIWSLGLIMAIGQFIGARIGAHLAIKVGARLIRPVLVIVSIGMALRLLANPQNPIRLLISGLASS